jgi:LysW-gamma-L-lysine carboxypeptidase
MGQFTAMTESDIKTPSNKSGEHLGASTSIIGDASDSKYSIEFLRTLLKINSVSGLEAEISKYLKNYLKDRGFRILPSKTGNCIGIKGSGSPILLLSGHMDTVPTNNPYKEQMERIYATGACDSKGPLASMFYAAANSQWPEGEGTIILAGVVHEEDDLIGIHEILANHDIKPDYAIFGEPTKTERIAIGYRGQVWLRLTLSTTSGHTAFSWHFDNLIELIMKIKSRIQDYSNEMNLKNASFMTSHGDDGQKNESYFQSMSVEITTLHAGQTVNIFPEYCSADVDIRIPPSISAQDVVTKVKSIIDDTYAVDVLNSSTKIDFDFPCVIDACEVPPNSLIVNALRLAAYQVTGKKISMLKKTGTTFTNFYQKCYKKENPNFDCITYGPGDGKLDHTPYEFIEKEEFIESIKIYRNFFGKFKELWKRTISKQANKA